MNKKVILIIIFSILLVVSITGIVYFGIQNYHIWLNEYTAQIEQFGFYKEDIKILNQELKQIGVLTGLCISVVATGFNLLALIFTLLDLFDKI